MYIMPPRAPDGPVEAGNSGGVPIVVKAIPEMDRYTFFFPPLGPTIGAPAEARPDSGLVGDGKTQQWEIINRDHDGFIIGDPEGGLVWTFKAPESPMPGAPGQVVLHINRGSSNQVWKFEKIE
ncbi:hypothetical protein RhiJN_25118 [Ceratobasidium sp. AG-Ba]|nr:hypothetical protein RhiJN_25118 [Ceratobasidium sp. AG-Ba]